MKITGATRTCGWKGQSWPQLQSAFQGHWVKTFNEALTGAGQFPTLPPAGDLKAQIVESRSFSSAPIPLVQAVTFAVRGKTDLDHESVLHTRQTIRSISS